MTETRGFHYQNGQHTWDFNGGLISPIGVEPSHDDDHDDHDDHDVDDDEDDENGEEEDEDEDDENDEEDEDEDEVYDSI